MSSTDSRDRWRSAVYAAEQQVWRLLDRSAEFPTVTIAGSTVVLPPERHFADLPSMQRYVDSVLALGWVHERWPVQSARPITLRERRGATKSHYEYDRATIAIPVAGARARWALREMVLLHELAHHLGGHEQAGHGPAFVGDLVTLAGAVIGSEVALALRVTMADQGVGIT